MRLEVSAREPPVVASHTRTLGLNAGAGGVHPVRSDGGDFTVLAHEVPSSPGDTGRSGDVVIY
jgi:hypothetical protein